MLLITSTFSLGTSIKVMVIFVFFVEEVSKMKILDFSQPMKILLFARNEEKCKGFQCFVDVNFTFSQGSLA